MHLANRFVATLFLTAALATGGSIVAAATPQASVQVRVYDSDHHDYHNWDDAKTTPTGVIWGSITGLIVNTTGSTTEFRDTTGIGATVIRTAINESSHRLLGASV